jgi:hypothetical protein
VATAGANLLEELFFNGSTKGHSSFKLGPTGIDTQVDYAAKLNVEDRNLHVTIDLDFNF